MNSSLRQNIVLFIVVLLGYNFHVVSSNLTSAGKKPKPFSTDFVNFLDNLGASVYNFQSRRKLESELSDNDTSLYSDYETSRKNASSHKISDSYTSARINKNHIVSSPTLMTQKAALRDVLMMKLVSYYEDKYKLTRSPKTTAEHMLQNISDFAIVEPIPTKPQVVFNTGSSSTYNHINQDPYIANNEEIVII